MMPINIIVYSPPSGGIAIRRVCWLVGWLVRSFVNIRRTAAVAGRRPAVGAVNIAVALRRRFAPHERFYYYSLKCFAYFIEH